MKGPPRPSRGLLEQVFAGALAAAAPGPAVHRAIRSLEVTGSPWIRILALGKAAVAMATAAADALAARELRVRDGLVVATHPTTLADPALTVVVGDHPVPGPRSATAADAVARFASEGRPDDLVLVLLSGGTSSLVGAPVAPLGPEDFRSLQEFLLHSGLPIDTVNRIRRRGARWGAGRLAAALAPARVEVLALADVPGGALQDIGSGPCSPDADRAGDLKAFLGEAGLWRQMPPGYLRLLDDTIAGRVEETAASGDPRLAGVQGRVIASNQDAVDGALRMARDLGLDARAGSPTLSGPAAEAGRRIADQLRHTDPGPRGVCVVWGGETTVHVPPGAKGQGGRCQELALAAAESLAQPGESTVALLAAGSDGRDGQTPAAGGFAEPTTWRAIKAAGRDPAADLSGHDSHSALAAVRATYTTGPTGTNVMDLVIGIVQPRTITED